MSLKNLFFVPLMSMIGCGTSDDPQNTTNPDHDRLAEMTFRDFSDVVDFLMENAVDASLFDVDGQELNSTEIIKNCEKGLNYGDVYLIINDSNPRVLKRYIISDICAENISIKKKFGYKNPYQ